MKKITLKRCISCRPPALRTLYKYFIFKMSFIIIIISIFHAFNQKNNTKNHVTSSFVSKTTTSKTLAASRVENVTQTIARILDGYDIRLRPNFGGKIHNDDDVIKVYPFIQKW